MAAASTEPRRHLARGLAVLLCAVVLTLLAAAAAHPTGTTLLTAEVEDGAAVFEARVPLHRLQIVLDADLSSDPAAAIADQGEALRSLFETQVAVTGSDGARWPLTVTSLELGQVDGVDHLVAGFVAAPADGAWAGSFDLDYRVVTDVIVTHTVWVVTPVEGEEAALLGTITLQRPVLAVDIAAPAVEAGFASMVRLGVEHFREGSDHLVFLMLVAAAALAGRPTLRRALVGLLLLTLAFALGHSASLALAMTGLLDLPASLIEPAIALTILLGALHLLRPTVGFRGELLLTLLFGFIHGFGFAGVLSGFDLSGQDVLLPTLGFNVGLELAQLGALLLIAPPLAWLSRHRWTRLTVAVAVAVVAIGWIVERLSDLGNPLEPLLQAVVGNPERLAMTLAAVALGHGLLRWARGRAAGASGLPAR